MGLGPHFALFQPPALLKRLMAATLRLDDAAAPYALGIMTGFLPCGLVAGWLIQATASASALEGLLTMTFFGLGTVPMMLLVGLAPLAMPGPWRARLVQASGWLLIAFGAACLWRAAPTLWALLLAPASEAAIACPMCAS
jgi:sulfite exporter TauE/SafE